MNRDPALIRSPMRLVDTWPAAVIALAVAVALGAVIAELLMAPPASELRELVVYLTLSGGGSMLLGWLALRLARDGGRLTIRSRAFVASSIGTAVALINVLIIAQLMFVSTGHDLKLLVAIVGFSAVITIGFTMWIAHAISGRLSEVAIAVRGLADGDNTVRLTARGADEVAQLAADVNALAVRLEAAEHERQALDRERRDLTAAISHDLRTPLASIRAMVDALGDGIVDDPREVERYYGVMRREVERLARMIADLFELARLDSGELRLDIQPVAVQEIAADVVDAMEAHARGKGVALALSLRDEPPALSLDASRIERALANLVRNAIEHTPAGGRVDVSVVAPAGAVEVQVRDSGKGIPPEELDRVWQRFYRGDRARTRSAAPDDGAGLGLSIVRGFVEAHGGRVEARSSPGAGSTFTIRLPVATTAP